MQACLHGRPLPRLATVIIAAAVISAAAGAYSPASAETGALCIKLSGKGAVKVRVDGCKPTEVQVGSFDTATPQASFTQQDVSVRVELQASYPVESGTLTSISFDDTSESYDTAGFHDVVNPTRLTVPVAGKYLIYAWVFWDGSAVGSVRYAGLAVNGISREAALSAPAAGTGPSYSIATHASLAVGDYVELKVLQNSGGDLDVLNASFGMVKTP